MEKNQSLNLTCDNLAAEMEGICRHEGMAVFVKGMLPGETGRVVITKAQKNFAFGRLLSLETKSPYRQKPPCPFYQRCGGCSCQHLDYAQTLLYKQQQVKDCLKRIGGLDISVPPVMGMAEPFHYRNKSALPVGGQSGNAHIGFFAPRSHDIIPIERCLIAMEPSNQIQAALKKWMDEFKIPPYNEATHRGLIRHLVTRVNQKGEAMAVVVLNGDTIPHEKELVQALSMASSIYLSPNKARTNVILGDTVKLLHGDKALTDTLCGLIFKLSPQSFFQINPVQTELLYQTALDFCSLNGTETVADLYCGAGTISLMLARKAKKVLGIEAVSPAIENAKANTLHNGITNADFLLGTAETLLPKLVNEGYRPDVITLDPPRKGVEPQVIDAIAKAGPQKIVYVSCNPATQSRDAKLFHEAGYRITKCQPVDMFCWTSGVENVLLLEPTK